ncbi:efflux RND transporter periplasmic adaptor subunit [Desulfovibrio sp. JC010]|uniref:efflux RND transporter periplasmic adaptor subunit n=1 Tax=Desulfovibrio sp. JC010 TaxID=2593641 RepID=UPI0013D69D72|nr:efflux RND transporter periplasmic adaptor subunit [Desulfovibrio sp. JC010]NDV26131.1 efflux RND transporter periplasmic adaptor subunit [Desulfovibrio sp. JC010]
MRNKLIFLILAMMLLPGCKEEVHVEQPVRPVRVLKITDANAPELRKFPGKVKATREATLAFRVSGQIERFVVKEGDYVKKGQIIAELDQRDFQAAIANLEAKLIGARSVMKEAKLTYDRNAKLLESDTVAQSAFDSAQSSFESSRATVNSLIQDLRRAKLNLQYTRLVAPFSGTIAVKSVDNHEFVQAKESIVQLEDTSSLDVVVDVPENIWVRGIIKKDSYDFKARAKFETYPGREFKLDIKEYQTKANAETQTYEVTLKMKNPDGLSIHPGMTAEVVASMPEIKGVQTVSVPISAVVGYPDQDKFVWVYDNGAVKKRIVKVGRIVNKSFEVYEGINPGEQVVVSGAHYLRDGQEVKILKGRIGGRG